jgi:hypothetical protein
MNVIRSPIHNPSSAYFANGSGLTCKNSKSTGPANQQIDLRSRFKRRIPAPGCASLRNPM